jgi:hypothetical protein
MAENLNESAVKSTSIRFPQDDASCGGFRARLLFKRWSQAPGTIAEQAKEKLFQDLEYTLWLPYPQQIATAYAQGYEESDNFHHEARKDISRGMGFNRFGGALKGLGKELIRLADSMTALNNSAKMAQGSIVNNNMGVNYTGPQLRNHTFSWKLTPKSIEEQDLINQVIMMLKLASVPARSDTMEGNEKRKVVAAGLKSARDALKAYDLFAKPGVSNGMHIANPGEMADVWTERERLAQDVTDAENKVKQANQFSVGESVFAGLDVASSLTTLSIPYTVEIQFYKDETENMNLFTVSDSFITNLEVNYTSQGTWSAHEDGSSVETQVTISLKEISNVHQQRLVGGNL